MSAAVVIDAVNKPRACYGTSIRTVPSCLDVMNSSPSRLRPMCRSARGTGCPIVRSISSRQRDVDVLAARVAHVKLDLFDRRDGLWNAVVGLLHRGQVGRKQSTALDVAEDELAAERGDASVVGEPAAHGLSLVVVVDRDRIRELVLLPPIQHLRRQRDTAG